MNPVGLRGNDRYPIPSANVVQQPIGVIALVGQNPHEPIALEQALGLGTVPMGLNTLAANFAEADARLWVECHEAAHNQMGGGTHTSNATNRENQFFANADGTNMIGANPDGKAIFNLAAIKAEANGTTFQSELTKLSNALSPQSKAILDANRANLAKADC